MALTELPHGCRASSFDRLTPDGAREPIARPVAVETPVAIEVNGIGYAVMMATPQDMEDFAAGFVLSERLADRAGEITGIARHDADQGVILRIGLIAALASRVLERVRHRVSESACGLCGLENLEQAMRPLRRVTAACQADGQAVFSALAGLRAHQPLNAATGAVHAAALCSPAGGIRLVREDVGRHNAFDKLIGAMARHGLGWDGGFALLSSRCSYELVEKAVLADCPMLATISAPTTLALDRARTAGLRLVVLAREDAALRATPDIDG